MSIATEISSRTRTVEKITEPPLFRVIFINDNRTSVEFVVDSLQEIFGQIGRAHV